MQCEPCAARLRDTVVLVVVSCLECHVDLRGYTRGHVREMRDVMSDEDVDAASWPCEVLSPYGSPLAALRLYVAASQHAHARVTASSYL